MSQAARTKATAAPRRKTSGAIALAKTLVHALALIPAAWLGWRFWQVFNGGNVDALGADPVAYIEHDTGLWALRLLMVTLAITPLRQLTGFNVLVRFRRMLGLYAFFYASVHLGAYLWLDLRGYWAQIFEEIVKRPYITSTTGWIRRLGRNWARLHKAVYAIGVLAVLHFWWLVKSDIREPALYAGILAVLLGWRGVKAISRRRTAAAQPAPRRSSARPAAATASDPPTPARPPADRR